MQNIVNWIILIGSLTGAITTIIVAVGKVVKKAVQPIYEKISIVDMSQCKNFLVTFLEAVSNGENISETYKQRAYEAYEHYSKDLNGNSYIHDRWEKLMKK